MNTKRIYARVQLKRDTEENWDAAGENGFIPMEGEIIIYSQDDTHTISRVKIGDGVTTVDALPFSLDNEYIRFSMEQLAEDLEAHIDDEDAHSIPAINSEIAVINTSIEDIQNSIENLDASIEDAQSSIESIDTSIEGIQGSIGGINTSIENIEDSISDINDDLSQKYVKPSGGIPETDLTTSVQNKLNASSIFVGYFDHMSHQNTTFSEINTAVINDKVVVIRTKADENTIEHFYILSAGIIGVRYWFDKIGMGYMDELEIKSNNTWTSTSKTIYVKPSGGIPETDLSNDVQTKLNQVETFIGYYQHYSHSITTYNDIKNAVDAGKLVFILNQPTSTSRLSQYTLAKIETSNQIWFSCVKNNTIDFIYVNSNNIWATSNNNYYTLPSGGIPESDLSSEVQTKLNQGGGSGGTDNLFVGYYSHYDHSDSTYSEIDAAYKAGKFIVILKQSSSTSTANCFSLSYTTVAGTSNVYYFTQINSNTNRIYYCSIGSDGTWTFTSTTFYTKPSGGIPETDLSNDVQTKLNQGGSGSSIFVPLDNTATYSQINDLRYEDKIPIIIISHRFYYYVDGVVHNGKNAFQFATLPVYNNTKLCYMLQNFFLYNDGTSGYGYEYLQPKTS